MQSTAFMAIRIYAKSLLIASLEEVGLEGSQFLNRGFAYFFQENWPNKTNFGTCMCTIILTRDIRGFA